MTEPAKSITIAEIAASLGFAAEGDTAMAVIGAAQPKAARADQLALAMDPKFIPEIAAGAAAAAMLPEGTDWRALGLRAAIFTGRARFALAGATALFAADPLARSGGAPGVHPSAVIGADVSLGADVAIGPFTVVETGAVIGDGAVILGQATIGAGARIGPEALIHNGVRIGAGVEIGARAILHFNAVIGADGFSFVTPEKGAVEAAKESGSAVVSAMAQNRVWARIHSLGAVRLGDDVEIGAGATIDRGTVVDTVIGSGTKIDNMVQIGHNCRVGDHCLFCGQVGLAGSVTIGDRVVLGGKTGVADHSTVGSDAMAMAGSGVSGTVKPGTVVGGTPAIPRNEVGEMLLATRRMPRALRDLNGLKADVAALKKRFPADEPSG